MHLIHEVDINIKKAYVRFATVMLKFNNSMTSIAGRVINTMTNIANFLFYTAYG